MENVINDLRTCQGQRACLNKVYEIMISKYRGYRVATFQKFPELFDGDIYRIWTKYGFLHAVHINYIARVLLVKSGFFEDGDIRIRWTLLWIIFPHQYLQVRVGDEWVSMDVWGRPYGAELGDYLRGFN